MRILNALVKALCDHGLSTDDWQGLRAAVRAPSGLTVEQFARKGPLQGARRFDKYCDGGFATPIRKFELRLSQAQKFGLPPLPGGDGPIQDPDSPGY